MLSWDTCRGLFVIILRRRIGVFSAFQAVFFDFFVQVGALHAEYFGSFGDVPVEEFESGLDIGAFGDGAEVVEGFGPGLEGGADGVDGVHIDGGECRLRAVSKGGDVFGQIVDGNRIGGHNDEAFAQIPEFADIAGIIIFAEAAHGFWADLL